MRRRIEARTRTVRERASDITAFLVDTLPAMKFIQSVGAEAREAGRLSGLQDAFRAVGRCPGILADTSFCRDSDGR